MQVELDWTEEQFAKLAPALKAANEAYLASNLLSSPPDDRRGVVFGKLEEGGVEFGYFNHDEGELIRKLILKIMKSRKVKEDK